MKINRIINLLMLLTVLTLSAPAHAGWFGWGEDEERARLQRREEEQRRKLAEAEHQLTAQRQSADTWQLAAGSAAVGAMFLLIVGTALGTRTRHAASRSPS